MSMNPRAPYDTLPTPDPEALRAFTVDEAVEAATESQALTFEQLLAGISGGH